MNVVLIAAMTADGRIARSEKDLSLEWTSREDRNFFVTKSREIGAVIMGRKTWETIRKPLRGRLTLVMTRESSALPSQPGLVEFTDRSPAELLRELSARGYHSVVIAGGASVYSQFLDEGLVNEVYLTVEPLIFSGGVTLTREGGRPVRLALQNVDRIGKETVRLHYRVINKID